jgi:hypothetical protein
MRVLGTEKKQLGDASLSSGGPAQLSEAALPQTKAHARLYDLAICAFGVASFHFITEWLVFGTVKPNRGSIGPLVIGCK